MIDIKNNVVLIINVGSSNIKFSFVDFESLNFVLYGKIDKIVDVTTFLLFNEHHQKIVEETCETLDDESCLKLIFKQLEKLNNDIILKAIGHRIIHGGADFFASVQIDNAVIEKLEQLTLLAPLHEERSIETIKIIHKLHPQIIQIGCFDTAFHITQNRLATLYAIPRKLTDEGIKRYGFHGLSYEYISSILPNIIDTSHKKVIIAHLGSGSSICALYELKSIATSMGFTILDGLMMATRCGSIDPGLILYLLQKRKFTVPDLITLLYHESGLLGVSGISSDVRCLLQSKDVHAIEAINLYCYRVAQEIAAFSVIMHGCDAIVFTAGIGEKSPYIRKMICEWLNWLGVELENDSNDINQTIISHVNSKIVVAVIPTNEEYMIAKHTTALIRKLNL